ncbi:hypothetical protein LEMLEM_LOCUS8817 [Lemmus lemmus]
MHLLSQLAAFISDVGWYVRRYVRRWALVADCGIAGSAAAWAPAATPPQLAPCTDRGCLRSRRGVQKEPGTPSLPSRLTLLRGVACLLCPGDRGRVLPTRSLQQREPEPAAQGARSPAAPDGFQSPWGRPPTARQPPGKSSPPGARAARATVSGNGCHIAGALYYTRTPGSHFASLSLMHVPWGSRWGPAVLKSA